MTAELDGLAIIDARPTSSDDPCKRCSLRRPATDRWSLTFSRPEGRAFTALLCSTCAAELVIARRRQPDADAGG